MRSSLSIIQHQPVAVAAQSVKAQNITNKTDNNNKNNNNKNNKIKIELKKPQDWADSIGSLTVISALIFGFSAAVLTNISQPTDLSNHKLRYFAAFIILLCLALGMSFIGLAVSSIMYHNVRGFLAYGLYEGLKDYEKKSYCIKNFGYYCIYISWATLIIALTLYCWVFFATHIAMIATGVTIPLLVTGILMGAKLANIYASYNGDEDIFHIMNPDRIQEVQQATALSLQLSQLSSDKSQSGQPQSGQTQTTNP